MTTDATPKREPNTPLHWIGALVTPDTSMRLDLGVDSLQWMNLSPDIRRIRRFR